MTVLPLPAGARASCTRRAGGGEPADHLCLVGAELDAVGDGLQQGQVDGLRGDL